MPLKGSEQVLAASMFAMVKAQIGAAPPPFIPNPDADKQLKALCTGIANAIVPHLLTMAQVAPGIPTAGSPAAQLTTAPGALM